MRRILCLMALAGLVTGASPAHAASPETRHALPFIQDDYAAALEQARADHKPIFIEAWAPW